MDTDNLTNDQSILEEDETLIKRRDASTTSIVGFSVLGLLFLLGYSYVEMLGWMYLSMGNVGFSLALMAIFALVLTLTSFCLPRIWSSNSAFVSKRRKMLMWIVGSIFGIAMLCSYIGVNHFAKVYNDRDEISSLYKHGISEARNLYPNYEQYVDNRVDAYTQTLNSIVANKSRDAKTYQECVGKFPGANDAKRIDNLKKSLRRTLQPTNDKLQENFNEWLDGTGEANLWNLSFSSNVTVLDHKVTTCIKNLRDMSSKFYHPGEEEKPYEYSQYTSNDKLQKLLSEKGFYISWRSLLILLLTTFTLIMPTLRDGLRSKKDL